MTESCAACRFFHDLAPELEVRKVKGRKDLVTTVCRRYPKSVGKYPTAWCGEFRRRPHGNALNAADDIAQQQKNILDAAHFWDEGHSQQTDR